jgi:integrase
MTEPANKGKTYPAEPLEDDELRELLGAIKGAGLIAVRNRAFVAVLWGSGLRVSEGLRLMPRDVLNGGSALRVRRGKGKQRVVRGEKRTVWEPRVVALHPEAAPLLGAWLELRERLGLNGRQSVFCTIADGSNARGVRKPGQPLDSSYVRRLLPKLARRAGIDKRVHAHGLRHTHATALARRGARLDEISAQLGHGSNATTDLYLARLAPEQRLEDLQRLWRGER